MDKQMIRTLIAQELERIPRGDIAQNVFRSLYQGLRESDLERGDIQTAPGDSFRKTVLWVHKIYPFFVPTVADPYYFNLEDNEHAPLTGYVGSDSAGETPFTES